MAKEKTLKEILRSMDEREFSLFIGFYCEARYSNSMMNNGYRVIHDMLLEDDKSLLDIIKTSGLKYLV